MFAGGLVITLLAYNRVKDSGGTYVVAWAPMIFGAYLLVRGSLQLLEGEPSACGIMERNRVIDREAGEGVNGERRIKNNCPS